MTIEDDRKENIFVYSFFPKVGRKEVNKERCILEVIEKAERMVGN